MTQLTQPEPPSRRRMRSRGQAWPLSSSQVAQSGNPSQSMGFESQAQGTGSSGQPDPFQQSRQPDSIDLLAARFSGGRPPTFTGAPAGGYRSTYGTVAPISSYGAASTSGYTGTPTGGYGSTYGTAAPAGGYTGTPTGGYGSTYGTAAPAGGYTSTPTGGYGSTYGTTAPTGGYTGTSTGGYGVSYGAGISSGYGSTASSGYFGVSAPNNGYGVTTPATMSYGVSVPYGATYKTPRYGGRTCAAALILGFVVIVYGVLFIGGLLFAMGDAWGLWSMDDGYLVRMLPLELGGVIAAVIACHVLGGASLIKPQLASVVDTFYRLRWLVVVSGLEVALQLFAFTSGGYSLSPHWPLYLLHILLLCAMIGMFEEMVFRGIILNGLLAPLGERRDGVLKALLISSFLFGVAHLVGQDTNWFDRLQVSQAILKIVQTGTLGFVFGVCAIHQRNITGVAVFHGFFDFALMALPYMLGGPEQGEAQYVTADSEAAMATIVMYSVLIALYIPAIVSAMRTLRQERLPQCGEFMDPSWTSAAYGPRPTFVYG